MLDIVIWGATGYTGQLVAQYIAEHYGRDDSLSWGIAGRNAAKLATVRDGLRPFLGERELPMIIADSEDEASLSALVEQTRVVCTTVGPYLRYGDLLVRLCAEAGKSYCDLTGETPFMRRCIDRYHQTAVDGGAKIVHACGFDSIPSDLGCLTLQDAALEAHGAPCSQVRFVLTRMKGGFSGGTMASMLNVVSQLGDAEIRKVLFNPYALDPEGGPRGPDGRDQQGVAYDDDLRQWTGPFVMAAVNTRVVRRSHALQGHPWGEQFSYAECHALGSGPRGALRAASSALGMGAFNAALMARPTRALLERRFLPKPGEGPTPEQREAGFFTATLVGHGADRAGRPMRMRAEVVGERDPGYGETAKMLGESAICLAKDAARLPERAGVLTPATAMGQVLIERLRAAKMVFSAEPWSSSAA
jgi:short subunit dehydrogenase-like uncharacterized protein